MRPHATPPDRPSTPTEALRYLLRSTIPSIRVTTMRDMLTGRSAKLVRRIRNNAPDKDQ